MSGDMRDGTSGDMSADTSGDMSADTGRDTNWTSWHLHLASADRAVADRVVTDVLGPAVAGLPSGSWFFVRYWQAGPHLRLRVRDLDEAGARRLRAGLTDRLAEAGALRDGEDPLDPERFAGQSRRLAAAGEGGVPVEERELLPPGVHPSPYVPEEERYGGAAHMAASEALFGTSSELCLAFLRARPSDRARSALALRAVACAASLLDAPRFAAFGAASWREWAGRAGYPEAALRAVDAECAAGAERLAAAGRDPLAEGAAAGVRGPLRAWRDSLAENVVERHDPADPRTARVVFSHVHMLHNRLGLSTLDELRGYLLLAGSASLSPSASASSPISLPTVSLPSPSPLPTAARTA